MVLHISIEQDQIWWMTSWSHTHYIQTHILDSVKATVHSAQWCFKYFLAWKGDVCVLYCFALKPAVVTQKCHNGQTIHRSQPLLSVDVPFLSLFLTLRFNVNVTNLAAPIYGWVAHCTVFTLTNHNTKWFIFHWHIVALSERILADFKPRCHNKDFYFATCLVCQLKVSLWEWNHHSQK